MGRRSSYRSGRALSQSKRTSLRSEKVWFMCFCVCFGGSLERGYWGVMGWMKWFFGGRGGFDLLHRLVDFYTR